MSCRTRLRNRVAMRSVLPPAPSKAQGNNQITDKVNYLLFDKQLNQGCFFPIHVLSHSNSSRTSPSYNVQGNLPKYFQYLIFFLPLLSPELHIRLFCRTTNKYWLFYNLLTWLSENNCWNFKLLWVKREELNDISLINPQTSHYV